MSIFKLYVLFIKYGLMSFGGGMALIPMLSADLVDTILTKQEFASLIAVAQITPGPIGINTATYVGFTQHGVFGAITTSLGLITPSMILVFLAIHFLKKWEKSIIVQGLLKGIRPAAYGLILVAIVVFAEMSIFTNEIPVNFFIAWFKGESPEWNFYLRPLSILIAITVLYMQFRTKIPMPVLIIASGIVGAFIFV